MPRRFRPRDAKPDPRRDVSDELRYHLDMRAAEFEAQGLAPDTARRAAIASFGDVGAVEAECVDVRTDRERARRWRDWRWDVRMDVRYALRTLRRAPLFTIAAVLTLALGIGGAAAVFTLVNGVLLRPLPYADPSRLVMVWSTDETVPGGAAYLPLSAPNYLDLRDQARALSSVAAFRSFPYTLASDDGGGAEMLAGTRADPALFATLGVRPLLGRGFSAAEARPGAPHVTVLGYDLWQRRFGGDTRIVGRTVTLSGEPYTVVGVMPRGFAFPRGAELPPGLQFRPRTELWTPLVFSDLDLASRGTQNLAAVARLGSGSSIGQVGVDLARVRGWLAGQYPRLFGEMGFAAVSLAEQAARPVRRGLLLLLGAVGFVLLIACANVANLLVARAARREREFATRAALGATRGRVFLQLVVENASLALTGGVVGLAAAALGTRALLGRLPHDLPRADDVVIDVRVIGATLAAALLAGVAFAAATAVHAGGVGVGAAAFGARTTTGRRQRAGRRLLVAAEVALSLVLLVGAGLLTRSFVRLQAIEPGFDARGVMTAGLLAPVGARFDPQRDGDKWVALFGQYAARLAAQPGVVAAGGVSGLPLTGAEEWSNVRVDDRSIEANPAHVSYNVVVGDYLGAMGIPLVAGRAVNDHDGPGGPGAVVVSETFVRRYLQGLSASQALGHRITLRFPFGGPDPRLIVGVAGDVRQSSLDGAPNPAIYLPIGQLPYPFMSFVARARSGDPTTVLPRMRQSLAAVAPMLALSDERPLGAVVAASIARQQFALAITGAFAAVALLLSALGLYAVIATSVAQRTRELGVRLALGATPRDVRALVIRDGLRVTAVGLGVGLLAALGTSRLLAAQLYEVGAADPLVYVGVTLLVAGVAVAATWMPARRATQVDPVSAIRTE